MIHLSRTNLPPGSVLTPRGWRDTGAFRIASELWANNRPLLEAFLLSDWMLQNATNRGMSAQVWTHEAIFEAVRSREFPDVVSRCDCVFASHDLGASDLYRARYGPSTYGDAQPFRFEIRPAEAAEIHRADMTHWGGTIDFAQPLPPQLDGIVAAARRYFSGTASSDPVWELLVAPSATVLGPA